MSSSMAGYDNPTKRDNEEIKMLIGNQEGYVSFLVKNPETGNLKNYVGMPTEFIRHPERYLFDLWDIVDKDLDVDAYHSINLSYRRGHGYSRFLRDRIIDPVTQKPFHVPARKTKDLSSLGAVYVDCDCYTKGLTAPYVQYKITELVDAGELPQPSYFKDSGQGLWAFWLLTETKAFNETEFDQIPTYRRIEKTIVRKLHHLGADVNCTDATRITRNHGSLNSKSKTRVRMHVVYINGKIPRYDLSELEDFFGCYPEYKSDPRELDSVQLYDAPRAINAKQRNLPSPSIPVCAARSQIGKNNYRARWDLNLSRFWALTEDIRGLIPEGLRHQHCFVLGHILKHLLRDDANRKSTIDTAAARLHHCFANPDTKPLAEAIKEITAAAAQPLDGKYAKLKNQDIADRLAITTKESEQINEQIKRRRSEGWPPSSKLDQDPVTKPLTRKEQKARRLDILKGWTRHHIDGPSYQDMAERLTAMGYPCDRTMVCREWRSVHPMKNQPLLELAD